MALRTDFKADVFEGNRKYEISTDGQGKSEILDVTEYAQEGDVISPEVMNAITGAINDIDASVTGIITVALLAAGWTTDASGLYKQTAAVERITAEDMPLLLKYTAPDTSKDDGTDYGIDFGMLSGGQCAAGSVTFYATDVLASDITVCLALGKKGDGRLLMGGGGSPEKSEISNVVITLTDNAAVAEGGAVTATCNGKSWSSAIKNGKAKLYASEVGNYTITVVTTDAEPVTYTTMLVCPYFGQFSTDIYSGTLVVTCTEEGGNGKTCNVRSCDDEYNPTDAYNLTQTFDTTLELTFLGIPSGKYLVTVDDKYVFFKEIVTIQNINSVQVQLKQWLYRNGDECLYNTGGWMKCKVSSSADTRHAVYWLSSDNSRQTTSAGRANASVDINATSIDIKCNGSSNVSQTSAGNRYCRGATNATVSIGTIHPINHPSAYTSLHVSGSNGQQASFRTGESNGENTDINTTVVLQKEIADGMEIKMENAISAYLIIGNVYAYDGLGATGWGHSTVGLTYNPGNVSYNTDATLTEIWLE